MGSDQIAAIRPALRELFDAAKTQESDSENLCVSFTIPEQEDMWIQALVKTINAGYPHTEEPLAFLKNAGIQIPSGLSVDTWEPGRYVTFTSHSWSIDSMAEFIDHLFTTLHSPSPEDYEVDVEFQHLA